jgi:hypothetical protein
LGGLQETRSIEDFCIRGPHAFWPQTFPQKKGKDADYSFVHKWIDDPQICQVGISAWWQQNPGLQKRSSPGMMAAFLVTDHWLSLWDGIVVSYVQYERPPLTR